MEWNLILRSIGLKFWQIFIQTLFLFYQTNGCHENTFLVIFRKLYVKMQYKGSLGLYSASRKPKTLENTSDSFVYDVILVLENSEHKAAKDGNVISITSFWCGNNNQIFFGASCTYYNFHTLDWKWSTSYVIDDDN